MFTVKHITLSGAEEIHQSVTCRYTPGNAAKASFDTVSDTPNTLWLDSGPLTGGTCFVMNENGKTISRYDLGASMVPLDDFDRRTDTSGTPASLVV